MNKLCLFGTTWISAKVLFDLEQWKMIKKNISKNVDWFRSKFVSPSPHNLWRINVIWAKCSLCLSFLLTLHSLFVTRSSFPAKNLHVQCTNRQSKRRKRAEVSIKVICIQEANHIFIIDRSRTEIDIDKFNETLIIFQKTQ